MNDATTDSLAKAQALVLVLLSRGWTHQKIALELGDRVSARTIYRWAKGEHAPQQTSDLMALERLANGAQVAKAE